MLLSLALDGAALPDTSGGCPFEFDLVKSLNKVKVLCRAKQAAARHAGVCMKHMHIDHIARLFRHQDTCMRGPWHMASPCFLCPSDSMTCDSSGTIAFRSLFGRGVWHPLGVWYC